MEMALKPNFILEIEIPIPVSTKCIGKKQKQGDRAKI
jgi:hypothetical protein